MGGNIAIEICGGVVGRYEVVTDVDEATFVAVAAETLSSF